MSTKTDNTMVQAPSIEEHKELVKKVEQYGAEIEFLKSLLLGERWLTRDQTMLALGCKDNKLRQLTLDNSIEHRYEGKHPYYDAFSIRIYLTGQKIDQHEAEKQILKARFNSQ